MVDSIGVNFPRVKGIVLSRDKCLLPGKTIPMPPKKRPSDPRWRIRVKTLMQQHGIGAKPLSREAGLRSVGYMLSKTDNPGVNTLAKVARVFGKTLGEIYDGDNLGRQRIRVIGAVAAGEAWTVYDDELSEVDLTIDGGEPIALEVTGDSMIPVYRSGDIIAGAKRTGAQVERCIGLDCIVMTEDGGRYLKYLARGPMRGRYNLRSYNPAVDDIIGVRIAWAAPVAWVRRRTA